MKKRVILVIRDGWGYRQSHYKNAIFHAKTPNADKYMKIYPSTLLRAAGEAVGLPEGFQGNSEVGHTTMGAGRIILQSLSRINNAIKDKTFFKVPAFQKAINNCRKHNSTLHIMGLLQTEGIHAHMDHLFALLDLCKKSDFKNVLVHVFTDGRDAPVHDSVKHVKQLQVKLKKIGFGKIATIEGRYYAMDRDKRWNRTKKAYDAVVNAKGIIFDDPIKAIKDSYKNKVTDEFILPRVAEGYKGIQKHDSVIFYNYRTDRPRQLTRAIVEKKFSGWKRKPLDVFFVAMTEYYSPMHANVAFRELTVPNVLGKVVSKHGKQLRISETEKYAHVTFFFNCQEEKPFKGEDRIMIPSPKVATYDKKPEMSAYKITKKLIEEINKEKYDFIVVNLVNCDMVGHTCVWKAAIKAVEAVDDCTGKIVEAGLKHDYHVLVLADHGNPEDMTEKWCTSHTTNPVPCFLASNERIKLKKGGLSNVAATVLELMGIKVPKEMDRSLL